MLLIQNGTLDTMTEAGSFRGDLLIHDGKIVRVAHQINPEDLPEHQTLNAKGLRICPGLVDVYVHLPDSENETDGLYALGDEALSAGVTTMGVWTEAPSLCRVLHGSAETAINACIHSIRPEAMSDIQLRDVMADSVNQGERIACDVQNAKTLLRLLTVQKETASHLVLKHLWGCEEYLEEVVAAQCEVILGACSARSGSSYAMASQLQKAGVTVAFTSDYPMTRLHHLPLCAGLCVRAGMEHRAVMRAITLDAAKLLRMDDQCGSIAEGKRADLVLYDGDPLMLATVRTATVCGGKICWEN